MDGHIVADNFAGSQDELHLAFDYCIRSVVSA